MFYLYLHFSPYSINKNVLAIVFLIQLDGLISEKVQVSYYYNENKNSIANCN